MGSFRTDYKADGTVDKHRIQGPIGDETSYDLLGAYAQHETDLTDRFKLFIGDRYTYAQADVGRYENSVSGEATSYGDDWQNFVANARLLYDLDKAGDFKLFGDVSQGFRAPNSSDLSRLDIARSGEQETASTNIDPEKFINHEIGMKARSGGFTGTLSYFYTAISDLIVRQPTGRIIDGDAEVTKANAGDGFVHGVEFGGAYEFNVNWSVFGNITWLEGEADAYPNSDKKSQLEPLSKIQPIVGTGGIRWTNDSKTIWTELVVTAADKADKLSTANLSDTQRIPPGGIPGYTLLGLRGGWQVTQNVIFLASLENLLNEAYRVHGSGSNEPGFGASLTIKVTL